MKKLEDVSKEVRKDIINMIYSAGSGHPGGSLSIVEILVLLYHDVMRLKEDENGKSIDRFILSKGHGVPALYAVLSSIGYIKKSDLNTLRKIDSTLQGHPSNKVPGIEICTGSLGQGLSVANGIAISKKIYKKDGYVYCLLGDGELEEGQVWEAAMTASQYNLDNLIVFVDNNDLQIDGYLKEVKTPEPIAQKFKAFGFNVYKSNGHSFIKMKKEINRAKKIKGKPSVIILKTIKGKGVSFMEGDVSWHGKKIEEKEYNKAEKELGGLR